MFFTGSTLVIPSLNRDSTGIIIVDADGQYSVGDVVLMDEVMRSSDMDTIFLGARVFSGSETPSKSKFETKLQVHYQIQKRWVFSPLFKGGVDNI